MVVLLIASWWISILDNSFNFIFSSSREKLVGSGSKQWNSELGKYLANKLKAPLCAPISTTQMPSSIKL